MAKVVSRVAGPDDPVFTGKFVISSQKATKNSAGTKHDPDALLAAEEWEKSRRMSAKELREYGLDTRDQLVISSNPMDRKK
tara:strand:+ start:548 stop:790 length:243 start_codon:yes stop_codon:yes gene_type:complete